MVIHQREPDVEPGGVPRARGRLTSPEVRMPGSRTKLCAGHEDRRPYGKQLLWFIALWLVGVIATALLVLPLHLLVSAAMHR